MNEYLPDHHRVFDTGNYLDGTTTFTAGFNAQGCAGVTNSRYLLWGANTPWKRVRLTLGFGTRETSLAMAVPAHPCAHGIPYILYIKSNGSKMTCVVPLRQGRFLATRETRR